MMKRVIVIGCPGSGKSTFARRLHSLTGLPVYHMDMLYWRADKTYISKEELRGKLTEILAEESWIIDGNYSSTMEMRLSACDTVFFLDYPTELCLKSVEERKGFPRPDMPWVEEKGSADPEFEAFIRNYNTESRPSVMALLSEYSHKSIIIFKTRTDADIYLKSNFGGKYVQQSDMR